MPRVRRRRRPPNMRVGGPVWQRLLKKLMWLASRTSLCPSGAVAQETGPESRVVACIVRCATTAEATELRETLESLARLYAVRASEEVRV